MSHPIVLIDFSSIAHPIWHLSANEPDPNWTSTQIIAKVHALASGQPHVAICADSRKSFRRELDPTYKAQREAKPESLYHQIGIALDTLKADGFPIWTVDGFEADDVIASAVERSGHFVKDGEQTVSVLIVSADKDLLQLVGPRVTQKHALNGSVLDEAAVVAKFGVKPSQIGDYLALVGDSSDNIKGAKGIGAKRAAELLNKFGSLDQIMTVDATATLTPAIQESLIEFSSRCDLVRQLVALRTDVPLPFDEIFKQRIPADVPRDEIMDDINETMQPLAPVAPATAQPDGRTAEESPTAGSAGGAGTSPLTDENYQRAKAAEETARVADRKAQEQMALTVQPAAMVPTNGTPVEFDRQLEPRSLEEATKLANLMFQSRLFGAYGHPAGVLSTIIAGREIGLPAMMSLRAFHIIENRPTLSAGTIQALVMKSKDCHYFRCTERTNEAATFVTKRGDDPEISLRFTVEDGRRAWSKGEDGWNKSGWGKNPADMCVARAASKLARLVYPDVVHMYAPEEFD